MAFFQSTPALDIATASEAQLLCATHVVLTFTEQKNSICGERVAQCSLGNALLCPMRALACHVIHLRRNRAPTSSPIHTYYPQFCGKPLRCSAPSITSLLRRTITLSHPSLDPKDYSAGNLRASGATALLLTGVDSNLIRLLGCWQSDAMLRYLHVQTAPICHQLATHMLYATPGPASIIPICGVPLL